MYHTVQIVLVLSQLRERSACACVLGVGERNVARHDCTGLPCRYNKQAVTDGGETYASTGYLSLRLTMEASVLHDSPDGHKGM